MYLISCVLQEENLNEINNQFSNENKIKSDFKKVYFQKESEDKS